MGKRILYLCSGRSFFFKDPVRKINEVAGCWRRSKNDVKQICGGDVAHSGKKIDSGGYGSPVTFNRWYKNVIGIAPLVITLSEWRDLRHDRKVLAHLNMVCEDWRPDIIWERSCRLHCAGLETARQFGVPYVLEWKDHLVDYPFSLFRSKALLMEERKNREADYVVVESSVLRDALERDGLDTRKIIVAHNAVQADQFTRDEQRRVKVRQDLGVDEETILVGYLGSYAFYHDTARLVLAADIIRKSEIAGKIKILMVGAGKEYSECRKLAEDLGLLNSTVIMKPGVPKDEVPGILAALDIAVLPGSTDIICPIKVQEYMAASLPTIIPDYACNREIVTDQETGVLFKPGDATDLANKVASLASNSTFRAAVGKSAALAAKQKFSWEATWGRALEDIITRASR